MAHFRNFRKPGTFFWHEHHVRAFVVLEVLFEQIDDCDVIVPIPALVEAYSVMTRLPAPHRLAPADAFELLAQSFSQTTKLVGLDGSETWATLEMLRSDGIAGGATYDAVILACAKKAGAGRIYTFNRKHFERLAPQEIEVAVP